MRTYRYSEGMFIRISRTDDTKYMPWWKRNQFMTTVRLLMGGTWTHHELGQTQHDDVGWFTAGNGVEKLQQDRSYEWWRMIESEWKWILCDGSYFGESDE